MNRGAWTTSARFTRPPSAAGEMFVGAECITAAAR